jgi:hypothetical protein
MYGMEKLDPLVKQHFSLATFADKPLGWLYKILGHHIVEDGYKEFFNGHRASYSNDNLLMYLNATFNPLLNKKLGRPWDYPTFRDLLEHCYMPLIMADPKTAQKLKNEYMKKQQGKRKRLSGRV